MCEDDVQTEEEFALEGALRSLYMLALTRPVTPEDIRRVCLRWDVSYALEPDPQ